MLCDCVTRGCGDYIVYWNEREIIEHPTIKKSKTERCDGEYLGSNTPFLLVGGSSGR
jgi:hypothetical protein